MKEDLLKSCLRAWPFAGSNVYLASQWLVLSMPCVHPTVVRGRVCMVTKAWLVPQWVQMRFPLFFFVTGWVTGSCPSLSAWVWPLIWVPWSVILTSIATGDSSPSCHQRATLARLAVNTTLVLMQDWYHWGNIWHKQLEGRNGLFCLIGLGVHRFQPGILWPCALGPNIMLVGEVSRVLK